MSSNKLVSPLASIDAELANRLQNDDAFRNRYIRFWAQTEVASEIRQLRKARRKRQSEVATLTGTGQSAISRIEKADYDGWTFKTLIGIAEVLKARLRIRFEPIEDVVSGYRAASTEIDPVVEKNAGSTLGSAVVQFGSGTPNIFAPVHTSSSGNNGVVVM